MGADIVTLRDAAPGETPGFVEAQILPGRGMMLRQARARLPTGEVVDALFAPEDATDGFGGPDDFAGNRSFAFGGAVLLPYANRIRGRALPDAREIETIIAGAPVRLPRNWGGKAPGAEAYAMHGLILDLAVPSEQIAPDRLIGRLEATDFGGRWPGLLAYDFEWRLERGELRLAITVSNAGEAAVPVGVGFHPYMAIPSGDRSQARLRLPARLRAEVNDYDEVLPTGRLLPTAQTGYDFSQGRDLGALYLDDCFTDLVRGPAGVVVEVEDPASGFGYRFTSRSPYVKAAQVYAPPDQAFVVVEPQFNLADPFGATWDDGIDTGMATLQPGDSLTYDCTLSTFAVGNPPADQGFPRP